MRFRNCLGMIWSVSTLARSSGTTLPVCTRNGCIDSHLCHSDDSRSEEEESAICRQCMFGIQESRFLLGTSCLVGMTKMRIYATIPSTYRQSCPATPRQRRHRPNHPQTIPEANRENRLWRISVLRLAP